MTFGEAMMELAQGKAVRREGWHVGAKQKLVAGWLAEHCVDGWRSPGLSFHDITGTDWIVIEESEEPTV